MKKTAKAKAGKSELPMLVTAMAKLVERLEALEKKTDQTLDRIAALPAEMRRACQDLSRPEPAQRSGQVPRERILYQTTCSDCRKNCEVPFKPTAERPVYCKECYAIRKAGHVPQDPDKRFGTSDLHKRVAALAQKAIQESVPSSEQGKTLGGKKSKPAKKGTKKSAKKKK
jgi:CxxC-x17-CxxC domain-containing protein